MMRLAISLKRLMMSLRTHKITFGKYKGQTLHEVIANDPKYIKWAVDGCDYFDYHKKESMLFESALDYIYDNFPERLD